MSAIPRVGIGTDVHRFREFGIVSTSSTTPNDAAGNNSGHPAPRDAISCAARSADSCHPAARSAGAQDPGAAASTRPPSSTGLWLAGLYWPDEPALEGHSDADVVAHAAADALFSAAGLGDLGSNFGTAEPEWAGASGAKLLAEAARRVRAAGFTIGNVAVQLIGQRPKLGPRRAAAEAALSEGRRRPNFDYRNHH